MLLQSTSAHTKSLNWGQYSFAWKCIHLNTAHPLFILALKRPMASELRIALCSPWWGRRKRGLCIRENHSALFVCWPTHPARHTYNLGWRTIGITLPDRWDDKCSKAEAVQMCKQPLTAQFKLATSEFVNVLCFYFALKPWDIWNRIQKVSMNFPSFFKKRKRHEKGQIFSCRLINIKLLNLDIMAWS